MDRRLLTRLSEMPDVLRQIGAVLTGSQARRRPGAGAFSFVEHCWHLADLEREGYGVRITRLLAETEPHLPDFEGERVAREREYQQGDVELALSLFAAARRHNLARLAAADEGTLQRWGIQDEVGRVALAQVPQMMDGHDRGHVGELVELLSEIAPAAAVLPALRARTAGPDPDPSPRESAAPAPARGSGDSPRG